LNAGAEAGVDRTPLLARWMIGALGARAVQVTRFEKLGGGAIQENWALDASVTGGPQAGRLELVLRTDAPSRVAASHSRAQEFALLRAAWQAGVAVPEPVAIDPRGEALGKPFYLMRRLAGTAAGHVLVRDDRWRGDRPALAARLGRELARIHRISPPGDGSLGFLAMPEALPGRALVATMRDWLDGYRDPRPALEWGLRWLERNAPPPPGRMALVHRDFRTGNYMVDADGLTGILDWEFAGWGDPDEDIGWFCARCWRFGAVAREAGGIGERADFYRGYEAESGRRIDAAAIAYWETMAHARWAVVALQQGERHVSGEEGSLALALTGRRIAELEFELLRMTAP
jgi:aminoglycoside phosphotransferase (APT) family kinase protein